MKYSQLISAPLLWLILAIISASSMTFYVAKIWSARQPPHFSDLYAPWWAAHELFLHGRDPYSLEVAHEIQVMIYGAPLVPSFPGDASAVGGGFAYPLYAAFLLWPAVYLSFPTVQAGFLCISLLMIVGSLLLWLRTLRFRPPTLQLLTMALFTLGSFPALEALKLQNLSLVAAAFLAAAVACLASDYFVLAGIFLTLSTFKPQFTILLIPWLALWTMSEWRSRRRFAWSFGTCLLLLIGGSEAVDPGWIPRFLGIVQAYRQYTYGRSLLDVWFTPGAGAIAAAGLTLLVLALCWQFRRRPASSLQFFFATSLVLAATLVVIPTLAPHAQLILLPGFLCLFRYRGLTSESASLQRLLFIPAFLLLAWPWIAATGLMLVALWLPMNSLFRWWEVPLYTSPLLPFAVVAALIILYRTMISASPAMLVIAHANTAIQTTRSRGERTS